MRRRAMVSLLRGKFLLASMDGRKKATGDGWNVIFLSFLRGKWGAHLCGGADFKDAASDEKAVSPLVPVPAFREYYILGFVICCGCLSCSLCPEKRFCSFDFTSPGEVGSSHRIMISQLLTSRSTLQVPMFLNFHKNGSNTNYSQLYTSTNIRAEMRSFRRGGQDRQERRWLYFPSSPERHKRSQSTIYYNYTISRFSTSASSLAWELSPSFSQSLVVRQQPNWLRQLERLGGDQEVDMFSIKSFLFLYATRWV